MKKTALLLGMLSIGYAYAQEHDGKVGINTTTPQSTLEIVISPENLNKKTNEGLLVPKITKQRVADILDSNLVDGTLVYVDNITYSGTNSKVSNITQKGFYYYDSTAQKWVKNSNGTTGSAGLKGEAMHTGAGAPPTNFGNNGDSYVDQNTGFIWTKAGGNWTNTNKSLKGATGPTGTQGPRGASVLSGTTAPQPSTGANGDSYVNTSNGDFYTKNNGTWTKTGSIRGAQGPAGTSGTASNNNIYNTNGTLTGNRTVSTNGNNLTFTGNGKVRIGNGLDASTAKVAIEGSTEIFGNKPLTLIGGDRLEIELFNDYNKTKRALIGFRPSLQDHLMISHPDGHILFDTNGFVGIGTNNPEANLDVVGTMKVSSLTSNNLEGDNRIVIAKKDGTLALAGGHRTEFIATTSSSPNEIELSEADNGRVIIISSVNPVTLRIPDDIGDNFSCVVIQDGPGQIRVASKTGRIPIHSARGTKTREQYSAIGIVVHKKTFNLLEKQAVITGDAVN